MKTILLGLAASVLACGASFAERADALKQIKVQADSGFANMINQGGMAEGNVVLTRGTLIMKAGKLSLTEDPEGYKSATLLAAPGALATFRQKRDGGPDLWIEGEAQRIEYDERTAVMKLFGAARIRQTEGTRLTNEIQSEFISYDSLREVFTARNDAAGGSTTGGGRGRMIIAPPKPRPAAPAAPQATPTGAP